MDTIPIAGLEQLENHLNDLLEDPKAPVEAKLFDDVELQLTEFNTPPLVGRLLPKLTAILEQTTEDPTVIASLTAKLLRPVSFRQVMTLASEESLIRALDSPAPAANTLAMTVLHKAAASAADAAMLSVMPQLLAAFIRRWLAAPHVEVGQKGGKVLGDLLDIDCELPPPPPPSRADGAAILGSEIALRKRPGQGKLWAVLFGNKEMYTFLLDLCSGRHPDTSGDPHQLSLAQGRVLRVLPRLAALNLRVVSQSEYPAATPAHMINGHGEPAPSLRQGEGLLQFAALRMVDKHDVLMHLSLVDFFEGLVGLMRLVEYSAFKIETLRAILVEAMERDEVLKDALLSLPERTVEEEAEDLKRWLQELLPGETVRIVAR